MLLTMSVNGIQQFLGFWYRYYIFLAIIVFYIYFINVLNHESVFNVHKISKYTHDLGPSFVRHNMHKPILIATLTGIETPKILLKLS